MRITHFLGVVVFAGLLAVQVKGQDPRPEVLPKVIQHAPPSYPPLARQTRISGDVRLKIQTDGEGVLQAEVESGHPLLSQSALDNVKTWKFEKHPAGTFEVTFRYKLESGEIETEFLECPGVVSIEAPVPEMSIYWAYASLGSWKAEFSSAQEKFSGTLTLSFSGPKDEWLGGSLMIGKGPKIEMAYGHKDGDFVAFSIKRRQPNGKRVKTYFVGKILKDKIAGTFVDEAGVTGEWKAARIGR